MTEHNVFTKKHTEEVTQAKQTLLDELNLPPHVTTYIRENKRMLQTIFFLVIISIYGHSYYINYTTSIIDNSSQALAQAILIEDSGSRMQAIEAVIAEHSGTGAANWATIAIAKQHIKDKNYTGAIEVLQQQVARLKSDAPELVLSKMLLAFSYEESGQPEMALTLYKEIRDIHEFMMIANINVARIYEKTGKKKEAIDAYERASSVPGISQPEKDWLQDRIRHLSIT